jgi:hypothetical protein
MVSNPKFLEHARKIIEEDERLKKLLDEGKLDREGYKREREGLFKRLTRMKAVNLKLIDNQLAEIDRRLNELRGQLDSGALIEEEYDRKADKLSLVKSELESEKDIIELYEDDEYIRHLQDYLTTDRFNRIESYRRLAEEAGGDGAPTWAWAVAAILAAFAAIMGLMTGNPLYFFVLPITVVVSIVVSVFLLHLATVLVGVITASYTRAFTCLMKNIALNAVAYVALAFFIIIFMRPASYTGLNIFSLLLIISSLLVVFFGLSLAVFAYCVRSVYDTTWLKAAAVVTVNILIVLAVRFVLGFLCIGCG